MPEAGVSRRHKFKKEIQTMTSAKSIYVQVSIYKMIMIIMWRLFGIISSYQPGSWRNSHAYKHGEQKHE